MRTVYLDANVIIEAFRIGVWPELSKGHHLETVEMCVREALTGETSHHGRVPVDPKALNAGFKQVHLVSRKERNALFKAHPASGSLDDGEKDLLAYLFANKIPPGALVVLSTADKGAIVQSHALGWLDSLVSLEDLLKTAGATRQKLARVEWPYDEAFLNEVRFKVRMGVIP